MTTQPAPVPNNYITADMLPQQDREYALRVKHALRCGVPGCSCVEGPKVHCPSHDNAEVPTLTVSYEPEYGFSFECTRCPRPRVLDALAKRGLTPESRLFTATGAQEVGLQPFNFLIQQPQDWLWPNRIPLGKLTLIAGYPSSGKTSIALDIAARVSRGASAPDQPHAVFPAAPVVLAPLDDNPKADILPTLRLFGADLDRIYLADLFSPTHPIDYYPEDPPVEDPDDAEEEDRDNEEWPAHRSKPGSGPPTPIFTFEETTVPVPKLTAPWPGLNHVMGRLANLVEAGSAALLIVDQVEDLASMHRAQPATILGMLKALAAHSGAAVTAMQRRLAQASVVFTTALVGPSERRFLVPLRPAMSDDAPAIPFALPPANAFTVAWRKPVFPAHVKALAEPRPNDGAKTRAALSLLIRALADGPRPAAEVEREAAMIGISRSALHRARIASDVRSTRLSMAGGPSGAGAWHWSLPGQPPVKRNETPVPLPEAVNG